MADTKFSFDDSGSTETSNGASGEVGGIIDPATLSGGGSTGSSGDTAADDFLRGPDGEYLLTPTGRRRRAPKSRGKSKYRGPKNNQDLAKSIDRLSGILAFIHVGIAGVTNVQELKLDKVESDMLATSVVDVLDAFDIEVSEKAMAVSGLVTACATIYGPRIVVYNIRKNRERKAGTSVTEGEQNPIVFPSKQAQFEETKTEPGIPPAAFDLGG